MGLFDAHSESYEADIRRALAFVHQDPGFFARAKAESLLEIVREEVGAAERLTALDVGCGPGTTHELLAKHFGSLSGVDVSKRMIERARREHPDVAYVLYDGDVLPFQSASFDVTCAVCVLHHVAPEKWLAFAEELHRVTRRGGLVAIFEHNPINPLTRLVVSRCEFDEEAVLVSRRRATRLLVSAGLAPGPSGYILFFPWQNSVTRSIEHWLRPLSLGAQYFVTGRVP
jgi:SAM-dependent methyltransferase